MQPLSSSEIRKKWFEFFVAKNHLKYPSSSLIPQGDTTVLLTTAGMQQMMPFFMGRQEPPEGRTRLTTIQKCFRTNDIDEVGDAYHNTFFEMCGNFSVGDYFKKEAVEFAFEFLTQWLKIPVEKLWITIHPTEDVANKVWVEQGIPEERIFKDPTNFWGPPGETGPCGPDSEIYYDFGKEKGCGKAECSPLCECGRFLEIWNLVFMEFFQDKDGSRTKLPKQNIDTGAGLERLTRVLQQKDSIYDTDMFTSILKKIEEATGVIERKNEDQLRNVRIIADHSRAATFLAVDGVTPSNLGRGYVMRRVIRRAVRSGYLLQSSEKKGAFLSNIIEVVIKNYVEHYPELETKQEEILRIISEEEKNFFKTLEHGIQLLSQIQQQLQSKDLSIITGEEVFKLYDTYGFPVELTREIAKESGFTIDEAGFEKCMGEQKDRSRRGSQFSVQTDTGIFQELQEKLPATKFIGYDTLEVETTVLAIIKDNQVVERVELNDEVELILEQTPFYARGGGQVGDLGTFTTPDGKVQITDTRPVGNFSVHVGKVVEGSVKVGATGKAHVHVSSRTHTERHHTATHLLHQALKDVFGDSVKQAGSVVDAKRLRFDFSFPRKFTDEEIKQLEHIVNDKIMASIPVDTEITSLEKAKQRGAMALFDGKYGNEVRLVNIGEWSLELCGGTHVKNTKELGKFTISKQESVGGGIRRIRAQVQ